MNTTQGITLRMTIQNRACTLRAIHGRRAELMGEIERLESLDNADARMGIKAARMELACLQESTRALWSDPVNTEGL